VAGGAGTAADATSAPLPHVREVAAPPGAGVAPWPGCGTMRLPCQEARVHRTALSLLSVLVLLLAACGDDSEVAVDDLETEESDPAETEADDGDDDGSDDADDEAEGGEGADDGDTTPEPDPEQVADPCAERDEQAMEAFIDVASPVDGQHVQGEVDLIGCASVFEGTVRYVLVTEDGEELVDDFTTAECGGPCVGEFSTTVDLTGAEEHAAVTLRVFWDSPADGGGEEDLQEIELVLD
jgi:hypothetical protein